MQAVYCTAEQGPGDYFTKKKLNHKCSPKLFLDRAIMEDKSLIFQIIVPDEFSLVVKIALSNIS